MSPKYFRVKLCVCDNIYSKNCVTTFDDSNYYIKDIQSNAQYTEIAFVFFGISVYKMVPFQSVLNTSIGYSMSIW